MSQLGSKKSRKGCKRCKQRRVKCDEEAPCSNCVRRSEECSLLEPTPTGSVESTAEPGIPTNSEEWASDLELLYHYVTTTASIEFGVRSEVLVLWRDYIPRQALRHTFLMHGLLGLAALHLAYLNPDQQARYLALCDKHQVITLKAFRSILASDSISPELADSLFALSAVISISSMARSCVTQPAATIDMDAVAEVFFLTKGVRDVIHLHHERIRSGPMGEMFESQQYPEGTEVTLPPSVVQRFEDLRGMLDSYGLDPEALEHCQTALNDLENIYENIVYVCARETLKTGQVFRWKVMVPNGYVRLVQARNPPALIILAYYAAAITAIRSAWYTENFAEYVLQGISLELDESMQHWLLWPQQQLQERMADLGAKAVKDESITSKPLVGF